MSVLFMGVCIGCGFEMRTALHYGYVITNQTSTKHYRALIIIKLALICQMHKGEHALFMNLRLTGRVGAFCLDIVSYSGLKCRFKASCSYTVRRSLSWNMLNGGV